MRRGFRHPEAGSRIDRRRPLSFRFDGQSYAGFEGDTLASALLANGLRVVGRSFKLHRPRGLFGAWTEDAAGILDIRQGTAFRSNCQATTTALEAGMTARAVNAFPSARFDLMAGLDWFAPFFAAGFYYKTFTWPDWHWFEPAIRQAAGLGRVEASSIGEEAAPRQHRDVDVLVVGGGRAGLLAAAAAAEAGQAVLLVEDHPDLGGRLHDLGADRARQGGAAAWIAAQAARIRAAGGQVLTRTTAFGLYDHGAASLIEQRGFARAPRLWRIRARRIILATGVIDRPLVCPGNDLPGVMSLKAAQAFAGRYGVLPAETIALASNQPDRDAVAADFEALGLEVHVVDPTAAALQFEGRRSLSAVTQTGPGPGPGQPRQRRQIGAALVSSGASPLLHLWSHAGGTLAWDEDRLALLPKDGPDHLSVIGTAAGFGAQTSDGNDSLEAQAEAVGRGLTGAGAKPPRPVAALRPVVLDHQTKRRQWIDLQNDVTLKDIRQSAQEAMTSVEHLKRFTTLGMATDQGKTANINGLLALAQITGRSVEQTGTTRFRPPFTPVPFELYRGTNRRQDLRPLKRLRLEAEHRQQGAALGEYGGWLRPAWYGADRAAIQDEARQARLSGGLFDASPLGKIEVAGPDAAAFLDFIYYNRISTLKPGAVRYGFMLTESGVVYDDGVILRLEDQRFLVSCSSSHVAGVNGLLEAWRQDGNDPRRIFIHDQSPVWSTVTVTGPRARDVVQRLAVEADFSAEALPHMHFIETRYRGDPIRVARVSFTGDLSFELSVPHRQAGTLWQALAEQGARFGLIPLGLEAVSLLRAEKGYIIIGKDTDGETMPQDLGVLGPLQNKTSAFVGDRGLKTDYARSADRLSLVGLKVEGRTPLPTGAHVLSDAGADEKRRSAGYVTSSYFSPTLNRPIALALVRRGAEGLGQGVEVYHLGTRHRAEIVAACQFDPAGERLHA